MESEERTKLNERGIREEEDEERTDSAGRRGSKEGGEDWRWVWWGTNQGGTLMMLNLAKGEDFSVCVCVCVCVWVCVTSRAEEGVSEGLREWNCCFEVKAAWWLVVRVRSGEWKVKFTDNSAQKLKFCRAVLLFSKCGFSGMWNKNWLYEYTLTSLISCSQWPHHDWGWVICLWIISQDYYL